MGLETGVSYSIIFNSRVVGWSAYGIEVTIFNNDGDFISP